MTVYPGGLLRSAARSSAGSARPSQIAALPLAPLGAVLLAPLAGSLRTVLPAPEAAS